MTKDREYRVALSGTSLMVLQQVEKLRALPGGNASTMADAYDRVIQLLTNEADEIRKLDPSA